MAAPPSPSLRACAACGNPVDPLRAPVVAILDGRFAYFCSAECKQSTSAQSLAPPPVAPVIASVPIPSSAVPTVEEEPRRELVPEPSEALIPGPRDAAVLEPMEPARATQEPESDSTPPRVSLEPAPVRGANARAVRALAWVLAAGAVAVALIDARAHHLRLLLASAACALHVMLVAISLHRRGQRGVDAVIESDLGGPLTLAALAATATTVLAWLLLVLEKPGAATAVSAAVWVVLAASTAEMVSSAVLRATLSDARQLLGALEGGDDLRVSEQCDVRPGDRLRADVRVISGEVVCEQWGSPSLATRRREGDPIAAGSIVREGAARVVVTAIGRSRAFARLLGDAIERSDRASPSVRTLDRAAPIVAGLVVATAVVLGLVTRGRLGPTVVAGFAAAAAILIPPARRLAVREQLRGIVDACRRGAAFHDADAFVRAGTVNTAIFCGRGTLHVVDPDATDVEEISGRATAADVLALAAGAERGIDHPIAQAIVRAAASRGVRPIDVRNANSENGVGVRAELVGGHEVIVGGRELCLRAHVPTAEHEPRIVELEEAGREVILVARGGRVLGLIALQYPLRVGALAAVQRIEDIEVEPVILGGGARARLEAIGRAVGITHVRPEILPGERGTEVRRIAQSGGPVAVIGRMNRDAPALSAADVAIALDDAGSAPDAREDGGAAASIALVHDRLVAAVDVLVLARATRARVAATLLVGLLPVALAALPVAFGLVRPAWAPLAALAATLGLGVRELVAAALPEGGDLDDA